MTMGILSLLLLTIRPRFVGLCRPTPRRHLTIENIHKKVAALRRSRSGVARLAARGRPALPDARRIVAALGRGSLLGGSDKAGAVNTTQTTGAWVGKHLSTPGELGLADTRVQFKSPRRFNAWRQPRVVHRLHPII